MTTTRDTVARRVPDVGTARRWSMLGASTLAQAAAAVMVHGPAFLIPVLHARLGLSLAEAGLVAAAPTVGVMLALVAWGLVSDLRGERFVLVSGLALTTLAGVASTLTDRLPLLVLTLLLAGASAASTNAASGRVVVGWFPAGRRGLAMGVRQMAQPVGVGVAALSMAVVADGHGVQAALWVPTVACGLATVVVALVVVDPPRPEAAAGIAPNPYRRDGYLTRIHGVSVLLVVPQFLVWTFALVWLVQDRHWSAAGAGSVVAASQLAGAVGRIAAGHLSDVVGSRMRPLRWVAAAAGTTMALLGLAAGAGWAVAVALMVLATVLTVADNGLAFTAVAERAGPFWSGRALGIQNTAQFLAASAVPPLAGLAVAAFGYSATFALGALFALAALPLVPVAAERELS
ncbi:MFS transporter [Nocardioides sp. LS1]|uniref:MFS transporter n=1 Tax=Nocardioides sp. LS1 TaxID=1027620 RepID=UPI000F623305|nr:MFS transporter [Nocardioides sp. LS1]